MKVHSAKGAHPYRKLACLEALRLATTKLTQRGTGYPFWGHPTQLRISRRSTGLIGSENWTVTALQRRRIEAAEMKLLRPLAGYTLYDQKTNDYIRRELRITGILDKIVESIRNWLSHLQRMPQNRILLTSYHYRRQGRRTNGRPKKRWREQL